MCLPAVTGANSFVTNHDESPIFLGGKGMKGKIGGYDVITDYKATPFAQTSETLLFDFDARSGHAFPGGNASKLQLHTGDRIKSHDTDDGGVLSFSGAGKFDKAVPLTSIADVAAAVDYLQRNTKDNSVDILPFVATIDGKEHTYVFSGNGKGMLIDLLGVTATGISGDGGQIMLVDDDAPGGGSPVIAGGKHDDRLKGGSGDDLIVGRRGDDHLNGGKGDDHLKGGRGADQLKGGPGDDLLSGGKGKDTYVFAGEFGNDIVKTYKGGHDLIDLSGTGVGSFDELKALMAEVGNRVVIDFGNGDGLSIVKTTIAGLEAHKGDFLFA